MEFFQSWLKENLYRFEFPMAYLGTEPGTEVRNWDLAPLHICIVGASTYQALTGNLAVPMLVRMLLEYRSDWVIERCYFPCSEKDLKIFEANNLPMFSLESKRRLIDFDILAFSVSFQPLDLNVIKMLSLSSIPVKRSDRVQKENIYPWIIRGGQADANPAPFMPIYDLMYIGEAEVNFITVLEKIISNKGTSKFEIKKQLLGLDGVLIPEFYTPVYYKSRAKYFKGWKIRKNLDVAEVPFPVKAAKVKDLNTQFIYKKPIVNYLSRFGSGTFLISRGCKAHCSFCGEGYKEKPYRELSLDLIVDGMQQNIANSGSVINNLSAFCVSSYRHKKKVLKLLLENVTDKVRFSSQRVSDSAADPKFMEWSVSGDNKTVSFGVEGPSERLRRVVNKHATEEEILQATENAIRAGYYKITYYMITGLPTSTDTDYMEFVQLANKIKKLKDRYPDKKVYFKSNWTYLQIFPWTPFQWLKPVKRYKFSKEFKVGMYNAGISIGFGVCKNEDLDSLNQLIHIGDSRLCASLIDLVLKYDVCYFRVLPKGTFKLFEKLLVEHGLNKDVWWRDKTYDEVLPWDLVSFNVDKSFLWDAYQKSLKGIEIFKCDEACVNCGVCNKVYENTNTYKQMYRSFEKEDCSDSLIPKIKQKVMSGQFIVVKIYINEEHRFLGTQILESLVRRQLWLNEVPIVNAVEIASKSLNVYNFVGGVDYAASGLFQKLNIIRLKRFKEILLNGNVGLNKAFEIKAIDFRECTANKILSNLRCHSRMQVNHSLNLIKDKIQEFFENKDSVINIRIQRFKGVEIKVCKAKDVIDEVWLEFDGQAYWFNSLHSPKISIYDFYSKVLKLKSWRSIVGLAAERMDFYLKPKLLLSKLCKCGFLLRDKFIGEKDFCLRCSYDEVNEVLWDYSIVN